MILTACNQEFLGETESLIKSCARNEPNQKFYLFTVCCSKEDFGRVSRWHPNIQFRNVPFPYSTPARPGIYHCLRSFAILDASLNDREPILYLDSDTIVRKPLTSLFQNLIHTDLMVLHRPSLEQKGVTGSPHAAKFNSGVIAIGKSPRSHEFVKSYHDSLTAYVESGSPLREFDPISQVHAYADQEYLYLTYLHFLKRLRFSSLAGIYNDSRFSPNSEIWHGKGSARLSIFYRLESLRYRNAKLFHLLGLVISVLQSIRQFLGKGPQ